MTCPLLVGALEHPNKGISACDWLRSFFYSWLPRPLAAVNLNVETVSIVLEGAETDLDPFLFLQCKDLLPMRGQILSMNCEGNWTPPDRECSVAKTGDETTHGVSLSGNGVGDDKRRIERACDGA